MGGRPKYYVDATGGNDANTGLTQAAPWKTIAKLNSATLNPGDSVLFKRGETWTQTTAQLICRAHVTYMDYGSGALPIIKTTTAASMAVEIAGDYVTLKNINIQSNAAWAISFTGWVSGADGEGRSHCLLDGLATTGPINVLGHHNTIRYCTIDGTSNNGKTGSSLGNGIYATYPASHHNLIDHNIIHNFTMRCVWLMMLQHDNIVSYNTLYAATRGIDFDGAVSVCWNETAIGNLIYDCTTYGINFEAVFYGIAIGNEIKHCGSQGIMVMTYATNYTDGPNGNDYTENEYVVTNTLLENNLIHHGTGEGIEFYRANGVKIYGNTIAYNATQGIKTPEQTSATNEMVNNLMLNNGTSNSSKSEVLVAVISFAGVWAVDHHNLVWHPGDQNKAYGMGVSPWTMTNLAGYQTASGVGTNSIQADPVVVDPTNNDFHLQTTSPCKNTGDPTVGSTIDKDGVIRGAQVDIGCYEFV